MLQNKYIVPLWQRFKTTSLYSFARHKIVQAVVPFMIALIVLNKTHILVRQSRANHTPRQTTMTQEDFDKMGVPREEQQFSLESEYEKYQKTDLNNWTNKRAPRPWEPEIEVEPNRQVECGTIY